MKLSIAEGLYLIALDDEEGKLLAAAEKTIVPGVISACVLELNLLEKIKIENNMVHVQAVSATGNRILDNVLAKLKSGVSLIDSIENLTYHIKGIQDDLNELLVERGILKKEATKLMWIPLSQRMDNVNYAFEQGIRDSLKTIVFKSARPTASYVVLMSLIYECRILDEVFRDKDELIDAVKVARDIVHSPVASPEITKALLALKEYFSRI